MFTYTRNERKWVRETTLYPLSFPLVLLKQKRVPNFFGTLLRFVRDYNTRLCINTLSLVLKPVAHSGSALNLFQFLLEVVC